MKKFFKALKNDWLMLALIAAMLCAMFSGLIQRY